MGSLPGELGFTTSPVGRRLLKTVPGRAPAPIFLHTYILPKGVL